jgi:hypothetical protein
LTVKKQYVKINHQMKEVIPMTIGWWIFLGVALIGGITVGALIIYDGNVGGGIGTILGAVILSIVIGCFGFWWCNNTADGARALKDQRSNLNNGLKREITVLAADGREIFHYKGKCDIESDHADNYILFEDEDGLRRMIYYGITDTVLIMELPNN